MSLRRYKDDLSKLAAWFTLKPLLATPLWVLTVLLLNLLGSPTNADLMLSLLPAIALTGMIVWRFKHLFKPGTEIAFLFTGMDALRWLNTLVLMLLGNQVQMQRPFLILGWILPNAYALIALVIVWRRSRRMELAT